MKRIVAFCLALAMLLSFITQGYCYYGPVRKLCRGINNVFLSPCEIGNRIKEVGEDAGPIEGATTGLMKGITMMLFRIGIGFFEVLLFPVPIPPRYEPTLKDPEFFFYEWPSDKTAKEMPKTTHPQQK